MVEELSNNGKCRKITVKKSYEKKIDGDDSVEDTNTKTD